MWKTPLLSATLGLSLAVQAAPGRLLRDDNLLHAASADARVLAPLARGDAVEILERQGGWLRVGSARGEGWLRLLSVRGDVAAQTAPLAELRGELAPAARRLESRIVTVAGFRGGEDEERIEAPGRATLEKLETYRLSANQAVAEATRIGLTANRHESACAFSAPPVVNQATRTGGARLSLMSAWLLNRMGPEDEAKIGRALAVRLLTVVPAVDDPGLQRYLNRVGRWLAAVQEGQVETPWLFAVLDSDEIHGFSTPGGHVFITAGLYRLLRDEAELAAVLAREMAHLGEKRLLQDLRQNAPAAGRPRDEAEFLRQLLGNGLDALSRPYSVETEFQADQTAVWLTARAGYDPYALAAVLQRLGSVPESDPRAARLTRTHPRADARLARLAPTLENCLAGSPAGTALEQSLYRLDNP